MRPSTSPQLAELTLRLDALARSLGLSAPGGGAARGQLQGAHVRLEIRMRRELILRARIPSPLPTGLQLESEQEVAASRRSVGFQDIQVGDADFDGRVHVRALNPAAAIRLLRDETLLRRLPQFLTAHPRARLVGDELIVPLPSELSEEQVRSVVKEAVELAVEFGRAGAAEAGRGQRNRAEVRGAASGLEPTPEGSPVPAPGAGERGGGARGRGPRPGAGGPREESGQAYVNRMRRSFRSRRRWMFVLRLAPIPGLAVAVFVFRHHEWTELLFILGAMACGVLSMVVWRCPSCGGLLDQTQESMVGSKGLRSCPHCFITLNP